MNEKNLVFASAAFHPNRENIIYKKKDIIDREDEYLFCFKQLFRVIPENFEVYIVDNTIDSLNSIFNKELKELLENSNILFSKSINDSKVKNIGVAELKELIHLDDTINLNNYEKMCYLSSRRFITNPYVFERTNQLQKDALISNPDFIYLDGKVVVSEKEGMYNDMFFAMKTETITKYIEFSKERLDYLEKNMINSESNLFNFINEFEVEYEYLKFLGFLRYDYYKKGEKKIKHKYHFV